MKLLADESVERTIITRLRADGHDLIAIAEESPGIVDTDVLARAHQLGVVLISGDKDFGELVHRDRLPHAGVLLLRLAGLTVSAKCDLVSKTLADRGTELPAAFSVLTSDSMRIRK